MVYIHVKKPRLMKIGKDKHGNFIKNPVKREASSSKVYDYYIREMEGKDRQYKKNLRKTGDMNKER